jgi:trans-aconitate methyltransferase
MNRDAYNRIAPQWNQARASFYGRERDYLDTLLADLPARSSILDLGCGTGRPIAEYVLARGHCVTGVDQASELLAMARRRFPDATWVDSRLEDFEFEYQYAGIICWDALFHIERTWQKALFSRMTQSLLPGGRIMVTVGGSAHPAFTDSMFGETFFYDSHPPEEVLTMLKELGLQTEVAEFMSVPTTGRDKGRFAIVAQLAA